jgi:hypothetical protein
MDVNRREVIGILAAGATSARVAESQAPPRSPDADTQAARLGYQRDAQRIAMVNLPQTTEPAFHFRA